MTGMYRLPPPRPPVRSFWRTGGGVTLIVILSVIAAGCLGCMVLGVIGAVVGPANTPTRRPTPATVNTTAATVPISPSLSTSPPASPSAPPAAVVTAKPAVPKTTEPASVYYASCAAAKAAGAAPLRRGEPGYRPGLDRDGDGTACDS